MPFVSGYFRRSPGGGSAGGPPSPPRRIDVAIYGPDDTALLRDRSGARYALEELQFDSSLPGGFLSAAFTLKGQASNLFAVTAGLKVIVRRGNRTLWWGWVEDIQRTVRGRIEEISVMALGPWQQIQQRLCTVNYASTIYGDAAIAQELLASCDEISTDTSQLHQTNVDLNPLQWDYRYISELVKLVCAAGNSLAQPMLFAVWEPVGPAGRSVGNQASVNFDPDLERGAAGNAAWGWIFERSVGDANPLYTTSIYNSPSHSHKMTRGTDAGTQTGWFRTHPSYVWTVTPGATYVVDYWLYFGPVASIGAYVRLNWYDSGGGFLSADAGTTHTSSGTAGGARWIESFTAPANAVTARVDCVGQLPDSGSGSWLAWDDVYVYAGGVAVASDAKPRAYLWPRDLGSYDYLYFTARNEALGMMTTTRKLANAVLASYSTGPSYTAYAQDTVSQARYRRRDVLVAAGDVSARVATATRDAYLAQYKDPSVEPGAIRLERPGAVRTRHGGKVWPEDLRAGDRLLMADGPDAGRVVLLTRVEYRDGTVTLTPERPEDVPTLLARV